MTQPVKSAKDDARSQFREDMSIVAANPLATRWGWRLRPNYDNLLLRVDMWLLTKGSDALTAMGTTF